MSRVCFGLRVFLLVCACGVVWGCAGAQVSDGRIADVETPGSAVVSRQQEVAAIPAPELPAELREQAAPVRESLGRLDYTLEIQVDDPALQEAVRGVSILDRLRTEPPTDRLGLERRILTDQTEATKVLHSQGYYDGTVTSAINDAAQPLLVTLIVNPGPVYHVGAMSIRYSNPVDAWESAPTSLTGTGLQPGQEARAADILGAADAGTDGLRDHGYPFGRLQSEHYIVDHSTRTLDAELEYDPGPYATMGRVVAVGSENVDPDYFDRMRIWKEGAPWSESVLAAYQQFLTSQGLFRSILIKPSDEASGDRREVVVDVADGPQRRVSAGLRYDTDRGTGVQAVWEHRNILGSGERFRAETQWWKDMQEARATFRRPGFLRRDMDFIAEGWMRNEFTEAFDQTAAWAGAGVDRRFWQIWMASVRGTVEGGTLSSRRAARSEYFMVGLPISLRRDSTNNLLDPTTGSRINVTLAPHMGTFHGAFTATLARFDGSAYYDLSDDGRYVLAGRLTAGGVIMDGEAVPSSLLFYSGGGGSVRGYAYQSLGPLDEQGDPLGGKSVLEASAEMRVKLSDTIGVVPFVDAGNVYDDTWPEFSEMDLRWAAGLGVRYFTAIGPIRFDVAVPLNKRRDDAPWQVYISIGQSF